MFGEVWGALPARVLALHGWGRAHGDFASALGPPSPALDVVAPDLPGFGATPPPPEPWGSERYAAALEPLFAAPGLLETCGADSGNDGALFRAPVVVVGHSFGGRVAVQLAASRPDLVAALVLTGVPLVPLRGVGRRPAFAYLAVRRLHRAGLVGEERMERARQRYGSPDYRHAVGVMRGVVVKVVTERYDDQLASLAASKCPVELVWSEDDTAAPLAVAEELARCLPGSVLTRCGPVGHLTPLRAPRELRGAVERALALAPLRPRTS